MQISARNGFRRFSLLCQVLLGLIFAAHLSWGDSTLATIPVGQGPGQIVVNPSAHLAYVVNQKDNSVSIIDTELLTVKKVIKVGGGPTAIAINPLIGAAYIADTAAGSITGISGTTLVGTVHIGGTPIEIVVDAGLNQVYVADSSRNKLIVLNATKGTILATLPLSAKPVAMAVNIVTHSVFVACDGPTGSIVVIDGTHNQLITTIEGLPGDLASMSVDSITNVAISSSPGQNETLAIYPANNYSVIFGQADPDAEPGPTAFIEPNLFVVAMMNEGDVFFALGDGGFHLGNFFSTQLLGAAALTGNPSTSVVAVGYPNSKTVALLDEDDILIQGDVFLTTGTTPTGMAFDPVLSRLFVSNNGDNTVSAFDVSPRSVVPAYEGSYGGNNIDYNYSEANPATGIVYTQRLSDLYAINEGQAGAGFNGKSGNASGVTTISLGSPYSQCLAVNSATNKIYVGDSAGLFYSVDGATNIPTVVSSLPATADIRAVAIESGTNQIVTWDYQSDNIYILNGSTEALTATIPVGGGNPGFLVVDSSANLAYAALSSVYVLDPVAGSLVTTIPLPSQSLAEAVNPATKRLYVLTTQNLVVINTATNAIVTTIPLIGYNLNSVGVNPITGNFYVGVATAGVPHVFVYNGSTNALITDLSGITFPQITGSSSIAADPLTDTVYVGSDAGTSTSLAAAIDGRSQAVSAVPGSTFENAAHALSVDLGSNVLAGAGYSYTQLWFPTNDVSDENSVPISVAMQGIPDSQTIATAPLYRTHNPQPSFTLAAVSNFPGNPPGTTPKQAFFQVDGWLGTWTSATLTVKGNTGTAKIKVPAKLSTGRHILYAYASIGDVATVQSSGNSQNSPSISPIGSVTFTVEK